MPLRQSLSCILSWVGSQRISVISSFWLGVSELERQLCAAMLSFYLHAGDSQLGPDACTANTLIHWPISQSLPATGSNCICGGGKNKAGLPAQKYWRHSCTVESTGILQEGEEGRQAPQCGSLLYGSFRPHVWKLGPQERKSGWRKQLTVSSGRCGRNPWVRIGSEPVQQACGFPWPSSKVSKAHALVSSVSRHVDAHMLHHLVSSVNRHVYGLLHNEMLACQVTGQRTLPYALWVQVRLQKSNAFAGAGWLWS